MSEFPVVFVPSGLSCVGSESSLSECPSTSGDSGCGHWQDAGVICQGKKYYIYSLRKRAISRIGHIIPIHALNSSWLE